MPDGKGSLTSPTKTNTNRDTQPNRRTRLRRGAPEGSMRLLSRSNCCLRAWLKRFSSTNSAVASDLEPIGGAICAAFLPFLRDHHSSFRAAAGAGASTSSSAKIKHLTERRTHRGPNSSAPSRGYSWGDGKMGACRLIRSRKKPATPTVSATQTLRFFS